MFGISSTEFLIILVIALVVIGPQKLPEMIRTVGKLVGKVQHFTRSIKNDLSNEFELDEIKKSIEELKNNSELQKLKSELNSTKSDVEKNFKDFESSALSTQSQVASEAKKLEAYLDVNAHHDEKDALARSAKKADSKKEIDDEESFDIAFDEAFLKSEAEYFDDPNFFDEEVIMTEAPKNYAKNVQIEQDSSDIIRRIVEMRQAEIMAETDLNIAKQFAFLEAKNSRQLLSEDEIKRRITVRQLELNR
ncbi:Sec-independent protein translocase protein TatB [Ignatzschineria sp. LJL83]